MLTITEVRNDKKVIVRLAGRLDATAVSELEKKLEFDNITELIFDMKELRYTSSSGSRLLVSYHKKMAKRGKMFLVNVSESLMEIFDVTGFLSVLEIR